MRTAARLCLVALALWTASCGGTPSATQPVTGEGNATLTTGPTTSPSSTPAASVTPQPTAPPTATLAPAAPTPAPTDAPSALASTAEPTAAVLWRLGGAKDAEDALFSDLSGLDVAGDRVYVADRYGGVRVFDLAGEYQGLISAGEIGYITDVKVGPDGTVYIADAALHQITMFNADLDLLGGFGATGPGEGEFEPNSPAALAVSPDREVFVLDPNEDANGQPVMRVLVFSATGDFLRSFPAEPGPDAVGMAVGPDGTLFIVNRQGYVAEVEPEAGRLIQRLGEDVLADAWPQMIAVDDAANLYVTTQIPTVVIV